MTADLLDATRAVEARKLAQAGMALFDRVVESQGLDERWVFEFDADKLDLSSTTWCAAEQFHRIHRLGHNLSWPTSFERLVRLVGGDPDHEDPFDYGFDAGHLDRPYLENAWRDEIRWRREELS